MAPKIGTFGRFVNDVLDSVGVTGYEFVISPLVDQISRGEALKMPFYGRTTLEVSHTSGMFRDLGGLFGSNDIDLEDIDSIEVTIKPRPRQNIERAVKKLIRRIDDDGLERMVMKARDEAHDHLMEVYLAGRGLVSDRIDTREEVQLYDAFYARIQQNGVLTEKVTEYVGHADMETRQIGAINRLNDAAAWAAAVVPLPQDD